MSAVALNAAVVSAVAVSAAALDVAAVRSFVAVRAAAEKCWVSVLDSPQLKTC